MKNKYSYYQVALYIKDVALKSYVTQFPNLSDIKYLSKIAGRICVRFSKLFNVSTNDILNEPNLFEIICFETVLHITDLNSTKKRKSITNKLIKKPELVSYKEINSFFLPYFNNPAFKLYNSEYFVEYRRKLAEFLTFYSCLSDKAKKTPMFNYIKEDILLFIKCLYTRGTLPSRNYKRKYEQLIES